MDALLISHKHSFLSIMATCCEALVYAAFGNNGLIPRSIKVAAEWSEDAKKYWSARENAILLAEC